MGTGHVSTVQKIFKIQSTIFKWFNNLFSPAANNKNKNEIRKIFYVFSPTFHMQWHLCGLHQTDIMHRWSLVTLPVIMFSAYTFIPTRSECVEVYTISAVSSATSPIFIGSKKSICSMRTIAATQACIRNSIIHKVKQLTVIWQHLTHWAGPV